MIYFLNLVIKLINFFSPRLIVKGLGFFWLSASKSLLCFKNIIKVSDSLLAFLFLCTPFGVVFTLDLFNVVSLNLFLNNLGWFFSGVDYELFRDFLSKFIKMIVQSIIDSESEGTKSISEIPSPATETDKVDKIIPSGISEDPKAWRGAASFLFFACTLYVVLCAAGVIKPK